MKIALMMENSQANKNAIILKELNAVADEKGFPVYNVGMSDENDHHLTYIHLGIMASILLNSKAVDFVVTGCGTGQGALMSLNIHPGVVCGYCIDPADAFLFAQINNGNALSLPFAKGFGWGAELNVRFIFEKSLYRPQRRRLSAGAQRTAGAQCRDPQPGQSSSSKRELPRYPARHRSAAGENRSLRPTLPGVLLRKLPG